MNARAGESQAYLENHKRSFVTCAIEDRISNLPAHLIDSILDRIPVQDAVKTSILSKKWRYRWTTIRELVIDEQFSGIFAKNGAFGRNGFIRIISHILIFHNGPLSKFCLHLPNIFIDSYQEIDQWIFLLSRKSVGELVLTNLNQRYQLPSYLFSCLELRKLQLQNCIFKPPHEFQGFLYLNDLLLRCIDFGINIYKTEIKLPKLKTLTLNECTNVDSFSIKAPILEEFAVIDCPDAMLLPLLQSKRLISLGIVCRKPVVGFARVEKMNLAMLFDKLPNIVRCCIHGPFFKFFIAEKIPKWLPRAINRLKHLYLLDFSYGDFHQLQGVVCVLRNSPNVERLDLNNAIMAPRSIHSDTLSYLEGSDCLDQTLNQLKSVEIKSIQGSKPELLFIKLLLAHSPVLEKMKIQLRGPAADAHKSLNFTKEVMRFRRASTKAQVFLEP